MAKARGAGIPEATRSSRQTGRPRARRSLCGLLALCSAGCSHVREYQPQTDPGTLSDTQFMHYLSSVPVVTFGEGCRAMMIASRGEDPFGTHAERYVELSRLGIVRDAWALEENESLDLGTLAFMASKVCALRHTAGTALLGSWGLSDRRYAVRQASAAGLVSYGPYYKLVAGGEMVLALAHIDEYMADKGLYEFEVEDVNAPEDVSIE